METTTITPETKSLLDSALEITKDFKAAYKEESFNLNIKSIKNTSNKDRVLLETDKGNLFAFRNAFTKGIPTELPKGGLDCTITFREVIRGLGDQAKTFVNVQLIDYRLESLDKFSFISTCGIPVQI